MQAPCAVVASLANVLIRAETVNSLFAETADRDFPDPDLIVVLQHWPDEFGVSDFHRLLHQFPLSRMIVCQGEWCAASGRTRCVWPPAVMVADAVFESRLLRERDVIRGRRAPLPLTATIDEVFAFDFEA